MTVVDPNADAPLAKRQGHIERMPMAGFSLAPTDFEQAWRIAAMLADSAFVPKSFTGKPQDCLAAMAYGAEIGLSPLQALQGIAIINGKPSLYGDSLIGLVRANPSVVSISEVMENTGTETAIATCTVVRKTGHGGEESTTRSFSVADAKRAGLWNKKGWKGEDTPWVLYPMRMLQMRARGFAVRDSCADILKGLAMAEEQMDAPGGELNVTPIPVADAPGPVEKLRAAVKQDAPVIKVASAAPAAPIAEPEPQPTLLDASTAKMEPATQRTLFALMRKMELSTKERRIAWAAKNGVNVLSFGELTEQQAQFLCETAEFEIKAPSREPARVSIDADEECPCCGAEPGELHRTDCKEGYPE